MLTVLVLLNSCGAPAPEPLSEVEDYPKDGTVLPDAMTLSNEKYDELMGAESIGRFVVSAPRGIFFRDPENPVDAMTYSAPGRREAARGLLPFGTFLVGVGYADSQRKWMLAYRVDDKSDRPVLGVVYGNLLRLVGAKGEGGSALSNKQDKATDSYEPTGAASGFYFPIAKRPPDFVKHDSHARFFSAPRAGTNRLHAACDLMMPRGTPVYAIEDGVVKDYRPFYSGTDALTVKHNSVVVRYGEVKGMARGVAIGSRVKAGQLIAYVGGLRSGSSMLHFELYDSRAVGPLTVGGGSNYPLLKAPLNRKEFDRNKYLLDATSHLSRSMNNMPGKNS
jgi:murein DD-endopeptidase MepM/ murein hydrolase activator NlpD